MLLYIQNKFGALPKKFTDPPFSRPPQNLGKKKKWQNPNKNSKKLFVTSVLIFLIILLSLKMKTFTVRCQNNFIFIDSFHFSFDKS